MERINKIKGFEISLFKKLEMIYYLHKRDKRIKYEKSQEKFTSTDAFKKAKQLLWKIKSSRLPILQNASYCYSFVWTAGKSFENKKYYIVDIYDNMTYARVLCNPAEIYNLPQNKDKIPYVKLYNNINRIIKDFFKSNEEKIYEKCLSVYQNTR
jgi:hypothetical protein